MTALYPALYPGQPLNRADPLDRYLALVRWAAWRYSDRYGARLIVETHGQPSRYTRIERAAFARFMAS